MSRTWLVGILLILAPPLAQQSSLRVLHVTPASSITPTEPVTVTFDRPVVGSFGRVIDAERVASLQPAMPVRFDWRDPSTLRLVPLRPWTPGQVVTLTIDTTLVALDGSRLTTPVRIPIRVTGPAMRATVPGLSTSQHALLPPGGRLRVLYSSEVDSLMLARIVRYEFDEATGCSGRVVPLRIEVQRPLSSEDGWGYYLRQRGDSVTRSMARLVEFVPTSPLSDGCNGKVVIPSLDSLDAVEIRYPISSAPAFAFSSLACAAPNDCASSRTVTLNFTAPVPAAAARSGIRVDGAPAEFVEPPGPVLTWAILRVNLMPRRIHRITLDSTLTDIAGRPLTGPREIAIEVGDRAPKVTHPSGFLTLPRGGTPFIRVTHVNADSAILELVAVPPTEPALIGAVGAEARFYPRRAFSVTRTVALGGPYNEVRTTDVALPELTDSMAARILGVRLRLRRGAPGLTRSTIRTASSRLPIPMIDSMVTVPAVIQVSNLAVHARMDENRGAVLVTDLRRGAPLGGATVTLHDENGVTVARSVTDSSGVALIGDRSSIGFMTASSRYDSRPGRLIVVERRGDRAVLPMLFEFRNPFDAAAGGIPVRSWYGPDLGRRELVFTDRDLYRPGERVFMAAVARDGPVDQLRTPGPDERLRWVVQAYTGGGPRIVHEREASFSRFGTSADSFDLARSSALGHHFVQLQRRVRGQWVAISHVTFEVKEYRAPEFTITLTGDTVRHFTGDTLTWKVSGRYLYDAPMRGSTVRWGATITQASPWELGIPLPRGFAFGDPFALWFDYSPRERLWSYEGTDTLDAGGHAEIRVADTARVDGTARMSFSVSVEDVNRQSVTSSHDAILYGSQYYLALRQASQGWWWQVGTPVRVELLAVRPDGSRAVGESITARLIHTRWVDSSGTGTNVRWIPDTVATWSVVSADTAISVSFTPRGGGYYTLQLSGRDSSGRVVESRLRRFAYGGSWLALVEGPPTRLAVETDSIDHAVGATAAIRFESPFESADAWVTVEREGLLRQFRRPVRRGPNEIGLAVDADMAPAALVGVVLLNRAPAGVDNDSLHRRVRTGMVRVRVDSMVKRLTVTVAPEQREVAPGSEVRMNLRVTDHRGQGAPAAVTVWAVDEGVLSMGRYRRPDPVGVLQTQSMRWLMLASTLPSSIPLMEQRVPPLNLRERDSTMSASLRFRGMNRLSEVVVTGVGSDVVVRAMASSSPPPQGADLRQDFRTTAFFRGMALTDADGQATVLVRLPDNITTYRLFAVAVGLDDRTGSAESTFVATRPLVVRAALPRFVRPGDSFLAGAAIGARDGTPRDVQVETEGYGISLTGAPTSTLRLGAGAVEARFSWTAREADSARVTFTATDGTNRDAVRVALPVKPDRFPHARSLSGVVRDSLTLRVALPRDIDLTRSSLTIRAGTTPLTVMDEGLDYLASYPYLCTEQLLASGRLLVGFLSLQRAGVPVKIDRRSALVRLQEVVELLARRQRADGAFGYWHNDSWSTPWLSTSVGLLLVDARSAGATVDASLTNRLGQYLAQSLASTPILPDTLSGTRAERRQTAAMHLSERLAATSYFRRVGQPNESEERALLQRESLLAWEDRVLLAQVLHEAGRATEARNLLQRAWLAVGSAGLRVDLP